MPQFVKNDKTLEYLEEDELLAIANQIREAGGANVLAAFMPSIPNEPNSCLIANALNFGCRVAGHTSWYNPETGAYDQVVAAPEGFGTWAMELPDQETARMVADTMDWYYDPECAPYHVRLPEKVGNTAAAFDNHEGWTRKYNAIYLADTETPDA